MKNEIIQGLHEVLDQRLSLETIDTILEKPKYEHMGDIAFPCFELSKIERKNPKLLAEELGEKLKGSVPIIDTVEAVGPYVNIFYNKKLVMERTLSAIQFEKEHYGAHNFGKGKTITMDLSSPNIAKPFSMGHLRSTVIGNAIGNVLEKCGYDVVRINYLGDWGTQFGKLIAAYTLWGNEETVRSNPIQELLKLYIYFHEQAEQDQTLDDLGREWFKKLENGDAYATELWEWFREESLKEFQTIYNLLGVTFDSDKSEAYHHDQTPKVVEQLKEKGLLQTSQGAQVVPLEAEGLPPALIKKSDGTTLYTTRDLAAAIDRKNVYNFYQSLYVVGHEQSLHFEQLRAVLSKMGYDWADQLVHIPFGMMLQDGKKMSTRKGKVVFLQDVLQKAIDVAKQNIEEKNAALEKKEEVAKQVGVGAVIFHDIKNDRRNDVDFSYEEMLRFDGETAPYLQYTHARAKSILGKAPEVSKKTNYNVPEQDWEAVWPLVKHVAMFPEVIKDAAQEYNPSKLAKYLLKLAQAFNRFYTKVHILQEDAYMATRLELIYAVTVVLREGLNLLGIEAPEEM